MTRRICGNCMHWLAPIGPGDGTCTCSVPIWASNRFLDDKERDFPANDEQAKDCDCYYRKNAPWLK